MGFCTDNCRKSYHKHGGAYRKLRLEITKEIAQQMAIEVDCRSCKARGRVGNARKGYTSCIGCEGRGRVLTEYGRRVLDVLSDRLPTYRQTAA